MRMLPTTSARYRGVLNPYEPTRHEVEHVKNTFACLSEKLLIERRIGSPSESGQAFDAQIDGIPVVVKSNRNLVEHSNEVAINELLSDSAFFLHMLVADICPVENDSGNIQQTGIIVMEKAYGDLRQILDASRLPDHELNQMMAETFDALFELTERNISHGDLHCGNVFLASRDRQRKWVIGDFGKSRRIFSPNNAEGDLYKFISTLSEKISETSSFRRLDGSTVNVYSKFSARLEALRRAYRVEARKIEDSFDRYLERGLTVEEASSKCNYNFLYWMEKAWILSGKEE